MSHTMERCAHEGIKWWPRVTVEKYSPDQVTWAERRLREEMSWGRRLLVNRFGIERVPGAGVLVPRLHGDWMRDAFPGGPEEGIARGEGNLLVAGGLYSICGYLILGVAASGANGNALKNSQTGCGVGSNTTAATVSDTHLGGDGVATTAFYQQMDASYPANAGSGTANGGQINGQMTVASANGNFNWQEWCWFTGTGTFATSGAGTYTLASAATNTLMINHWEGTSLGTKGSGATWVFSTTITLSLS